MSCSWMNFFTEVLLKNYSYMFAYPADLNRADSYTKLQLIVHAFVKFYMKIYSSINVMV